MATANRDLSEYNKNELPNLGDYQMGIITSLWNQQITKNLTQGVTETLLDLGLPKESLQEWLVPGSFELIYAAKQICTAQELDALIVVGSLIEGETPHFDYVAQAVAQGIKEVNLQYKTPTIFCVLTDNDESQSVARSGGTLGNKGIEAAVSAAMMAEFKRQLNHNL